MFEGWIWLVAAGVLAAGLAAVGAGVWLQRKGRQGMGLDRARRLFHLRREWLEARFFTIASRSGKPRGLEWVECEFEDGVSFARDRTSGQLRALVAITIRFRAVEGGGMEDNPNVANLRAASAVFTLEGEEWTTAGRALLNLSPAQAIEHFHHELETAE